MRLAPALVRNPSTMRPAAHVCVKVPSPKEELRAAYLQCSDREAWVRHQLGSNGTYVGRPKNDGGCALLHACSKRSLRANCVAHI